MRLETRTAILRAMAARVEDGEPLEEGIAEDILREAANRPSRPGFGPFGRQSTIFKS